MLPTHGGYPITSFPSHTEGSVPVFSIHRRRHWRERSKRNHLRSVIQYSCEFVRTPLQVHHPLILEDGRRSCLRVNTLSSRIFTYEVRVKLEVYWRWNVLWDSVLVGLFGEGLKNTYLWLLRITKFDDSKPPLNNTSLSIDYVPRCFTFPESRDTEGFILDGWLWTRNRDSPLGFRIRGNRNTI